MLTIDYRFRWLQDGRGQWDAFFSDGRMAESHTPPRIEPQHREAEKEKARLALVDLVNAQPGGAPC